MPREVAVVRYEGKRWVVWRLKYREASRRMSKRVLNAAEVANRGRRASAVSARAPQIGEGR
jgi:hypothetical protein